MARTYIDVKVFNVLIYGLTSLLFVPCLDWALQKIIESLGTRHLLRGGIVRWGGVRLGRLYPVPYSYNRNTRLIAIGVGLMIHVTSLLGESGFGAAQPDSPTELLRSHESDILIYIGACNRTELDIHGLNETHHLNISEKFNTPEDCWKSGHEDLTASSYNYEILNEELSVSIFRISSGYRLQYTKAKA